MYQAHSTSFGNHFIGMSMHQIFNLEGTQFLPDEDESSLAKWLRASGEF